MISTPAIPLLTQGMKRNVVIAAGVVLFHAALLWALQTGLLRRAVEIIVPVQILSEIIAPAPPPAPPPPQPRPQPQIAPAVRPAARQPVAPPAPQPLAIADPTPTPQAPIGVLTPQPPAPPITTPVALAPAAPPAPPAPPRIVLPSSDADYLANPRPAYPPLSKRLGEQGKVVVRVLIGTDGAAQKAEIRTSSGFDRLDQAALATVQRWRYVPGKRDGVPEAMWFNVPINFVLE
jgi:protein TonB